MPAKTSPKCPKKRKTSDSKKLLAWMRCRNAPATIEDIMKAMGWSYHKTRKVAHKCLIPSINRPKQGRQGAVIRYALPSQVNKNANHLGIAHFEEGYYHIKGKAEDALRYIIGKKDDGLTVHEAKILFHHDLTNILNNLEQHPKIEVVEFEGERVWVFRSKKKAQLNRRKCNNVYKRQKKMDEALEKNEPIPIPVDEIMENIEILHQETEGIPLPMIARFGILKHLRGWSDRRTARELRNALRRDRAADSLPAYCHSTISKKFRKTDEDDMRELERWLIGELIRRKGITMGVIAGDSTHLDAYCSERKINKGGIEGAAWGFHGDWFYGYKLHALVCSESELPIYWTLTSGNDSDVSQMYALVDGFCANYPDLTPDALTLDAGYDSVEHKKSAEGRLGCAVITAKNPRRNKMYQKAKETVSKMWEVWGGKLRSVIAYMNRIPQKVITELKDAVEYSLMAELIRNLMFMRKRISVERFFGRLKEFTMANKLVHQSESEVRKFIRWAIIAMLVFSLTMVLKGISDVKLSYGHLV